MLRGVGYCLVILPRVGLLIEDTPKYCTIHWLQLCLVFDYFQGVPFCTTKVHLCTKFHELYRLYNVLYHIVTVWFADVDKPKIDKSSCSLC